MYSHYLHLRGLEPFAPPQTRPAPRTIFGSTARRCRFGVPATGPTLPVPDERIEPELPPTSRLLKIASFSCGQ
jgi:hypothetical protein